MTRKLLTTTLATIASCGLAVGVAGPAFADNNPVPNPPVSSAPSAPSDVVGTTKARCDAAIDRRVADLATWTVKVQAAKRLSDAQKSTLTTELSSVSTALTTVAKPAVDGASDRASLKAACQAIVVDYRVYRVVHPQVFITGAADSELDAIATLQAFSATLLAKGADTSAVDALLATAQTNASGIPDRVAPVTAASYDADPAGTQAIFAGARHDLSTVKLQIRQSRVMLRLLARSTH